MSPERWEQVKDILNGALDRCVPADRAAFLDEACGQDASLRAEVESLLVAGAKGEGLEQSPLRKLTGPVRLFTESAVRTITTPLGRSEPGDQYVGPRVDLCNFGDYELLEEIGHGGMGVVYRARQLSLNRMVALKMILAGQLASKGDVLRFRAEAEAAAHLDHPNIVSIYEVGEHEGHHYFSMRLVAGTNLSTELERFRQMLRAGARLLSTVCRAVHHAHQRGILHRDLKPANIILDENDQPHVTDFGLAKRIHGGASVTVTGLVIGTPSYMAPEVASGKTKQVAITTDVYSLGAILYELMTGRPPFTAETTWETLRQVIESEPTRPRAIDPSVDRDLETICLRCLEKEPERRYGSAEALAQDLDCWLAHKPILARPSALWERAAKWARRRPAIAGLGTLVILATIAGAAGVLWQWQRAEGALKEASARAVAEANAKNTAEEARQAEADARRREEEQRKQAVRARVDAEAKRLIAEQERQKAAQSLKTSEANLYLNQIALAHQEWQNNNVVHADEILEACPRELRGWEWYFLKLLCNSSPLTLRGHASAVTHVAFSPDGRWVASGGQDQTVVVWEAASGRVVSTFSGHRGPISSVAFSGDGARLMSAAWDGTVKIWEPTTGHELITLPGTGPVFGAAMSPDSLLVARINWPADVKLRVADASAADLQLSIEIPKDAPERLKQLVRIPPAIHTTVNVSDAISGKGIFSVQGSFGPGGAVAFSPDGTALAAIGWNDALSVWNVPSGTQFLGSPPDSPARFDEVGRLLSFLARSSGDLAQFFRMQVSPLSLAFSPDGRRLVYSSWDGTVTLKDLKELTAGRDGLVLTRTTTRASNVAFSPDGASVAAATGDGIKVWHAFTATELFVLRGHDGGVSSVAYAPKGTQLASGGLDHTVKLWNLTKTSPGRSLPGQTDLVRGIAFSPDGKLLATASRDKTVKVWPTKNGQDAVTLLGHRTPVDDVAFSPDGHTLASRAIDGSIKLWDPTTGREIASMGRDIGETPKAYNLDEVVRVVFTPDGTRVASAYRSDGAIDVWDVSRSERVSRLWGPGGRPGGMALSPDGKRLASAGSRDEFDLIMVWDLETGKETFRISERGHGVANLVFSPDGRQLASAGLDRTIKLWDARSAETLSTLVGHSGKVKAIAFTPDARRLASGGEDGCIRVWDPSTRQATLTLCGVCSSVEGLAFSPDASQLAAACVDGTVKLLEAAYAHQ